MGAIEIMNNRKYIGRCDHCDDAIYDDEKWYEVKRKYGWDLMFCKNCVIEHNVIEEEDTDDIRRKAGTTTPNQPVVGGCGA